MNRLLTWNVLTRQERHCTVRRGRQWTQFHQPWMHYFITQSKLPTKLEYGPPLNSQQHAPTQEGWGWILDEDSKSWDTVWNTKLVKCGCKSLKGCVGKRACKKAQWNCTELCSCNIHAPTYLDSKIKSVSGVEAKLLVFGAFYMAAILAIHDGHHNVYSECYN